MRITQGEMSTNMVSAIRRAPRLRLRMNQFHMTANPAKGRMTERVRAASARKKPESRAVDKSRDLGIGDF